MLNYLKLHKDKNDFDIPKYEFVEEIIDVDEIDYYHSNSIARSSKTMTECKNLKITTKNTGATG